MPAAHHDANHSGRSTRCTDPATDSQRAGLVEGDHVHSTHLFDHAPDFDQDAGFPASPIVATTAVGVAAPVRTGRPPPARLQLAEHPRSTGKQR